MFHASFVFHVQQAHHLSLTQYCGKFVIALRWGCSPSLAMWRIAASHEPVLRDIVMAHVFGVKWHYQSLCTSLYKESFATLLPPQCQLWCMSPTS